MAATTTFPRHIFHHTPATAREHHGQPTKPPAAAPAQYQQATLKPPNAAKAISTTQTRPALITKDTNKPLSPPKKSAASIQANPVQKPHKPHPAAPPKPALKKTTHNVLAPIFAGISKPAAKSNYGTTTINRLKPSTVSISATVAKGNPGVAKKHAATGTGTANPQGAAKLKSKPRAKPNTPLHPLAVAFTTASETYRETSASHLPLLLAKTISNLTTQLTDCHLASQKLLDDVAVTGKGLTLPFREEGLMVRILGKDGGGGSGVNGKVRTSVGARVQGFRDVVREEEGVLRGLWGRWGVVVGRIGVLALNLDDCGVGVGGKGTVGAGAGPDGDGGKGEEGKKSGSAVKTGVNARGDRDGRKAYAMRYKELEAEYMRKRAEIVKNFDIEAAELVAGARDREKKYVKQNRELKATITGLLQALRHVDDDELGMEEGEERGRQ